MIYRHASERDNNISLKSIRNLVFILSLSIAKIDYFNKSCKNKRSRGQCLIKLGLRAFISYYYEAIFFHYNILKDSNIILAFATISRVFNRIKTLLKVCQQESLFNLNY